MVRHTVSEGVPKLIPPLGGEIGLLAPLARALNQYPPVLDTRQHEDRLECDLVQSTETSVPIVVRLHGRGA